MAQRDRAPYRPQDVHEVSVMLQGLQANCGKGGKGKGGFSCRKTSYQLPNGQEVVSWKMQDWDYKKENLPTYARGLFTSLNSKKQPEIVVRGYDKFFNHGEVRKTEWENVQKNTRGPYELSVKENGCIIFIAGMDDNSLIVCSKHSTGGRGDPEKAHSIWGERWIDRQLKQLGRTRADLAKTLRAMNATAVAELCDDDFEEHVLAYKPEEAGLYLHGLNLNLPEFATYPGHFVDRFAEEWGFRKVMYIMEDDITKVKTFLDKVAETGNYAGRDTEGFVIRCQARESENSPWHDWFFKYKFEEPYLMYRQWRECTKAIIAGRQPRFKKHKTITEKYLFYARKRLAQDRNLGNQYNQNHGIIALRDDFLREEGTTGAEVIQQELLRGEGERDVSHNVVLVPVATIGCGKTTVALALCSLFGWGHFQNDNITTTKGRPQKFATEICHQLAQYPVVVADRNNHQRREREQLIRDVSAIVPNAIFVALHYVHDKRNLEGVREAMFNRVLSRGDNHQTIQAAKDKNKVIGIMEGFLDRFQPVDRENPPDSDFDLVIDLNPELDSRENLETVVSKLHEEYPKLFGEMPSAHDLDAAIDGALNNYKPDIRVDLSNAFNKGKGKEANRAATSARDPATTSREANRTVPLPTPPARKQPKPIYYAIRLPAERLKAILSALFRDKPAETARLYRHLEQSRRIQSEFHVTLVHGALAKQFPAQWERLDALWKAVYQPLWDQAVREGKMAPREPELGRCQVQLERVVWDERIMAFVVRISKSGGGSEGGFETVNKVAHVTVGTANSTVKPKESNDLLERWLQVGSGVDTGISEEVVKGDVVLDGVVVGVPGR